MRVTLNGINRRGLVEWRGRERFIGRTVRIWSAEHKAWWRPNGSGYTRDPDRAGLYDFADAYDRTKHCGPEKRIAYEVAPETLLDRHDAPLNIHEREAE